MERYADNLGQGRRDAAFRFYEAFQYVVLALAYDVRELSELEPTATPLLQAAARQLDVLYPGSSTPMTWAAAEARAAEPRLEPGR